VRLHDHDGQETNWPSSALIIKKQWCDAILYNHKSWEIRSFPSLPYLI